MLGVRFGLLFAGVLTFESPRTAAAQDVVPAAPSSADDAESLPDQKLGEPSPAPPTATVPAAPAPAVPAPGPPTPARAAHESASRPATPAPTPAESPVTERPRARPNWDIGVGMSLADSASYASFYASSFPNLPTYRASFERRIHNDTWLTFTGSFTHSSTDVPVSTQFDPPLRSTIEIQSTSVSALLGIRQVLMSDIVDVSWFGAASGAWYWITGDTLQPGESVQTLPGTHGRSLGFVSGITVERQLIDRLSVRLSSEILGVQWSRWELGPTPAQASGDEEPPITHRAQTTVLHVAPVLDLRFYF